jgi:hypothetical protein
MVASSPGLLYVGGNNGIIYRSANADAALPGSVTFTTITALANSGIRGLGVLADNDYLVSFSTGAIRHSEDAGATWVNISQTGRMLGSIAMPELHSSWITGEAGRIYRQSPLATVSDYGAGTNWGSASTTSSFGACLQAKGASTVADWTLDAANVAGQCQALDTDPWQAIPTAPVKVAHTAVAGNTGSVSIVFGMRPASNQPAASYSATVVFEALSPNV